MKTNKTNSTQVKAKETNPRRMNLTHPNPSESKRD
jgi:hypothetical protein